jgi:hypothetical protein
LRFGSPVAGIGIINLQLIRVNSIYDQFTARAQLVDDSGLLARNLRISAALAARGDISNQ